MSALRPTTVFVVVYVILAAVDLVWLQSDELQYKSPSQVLTDDLSLLVLISVVLTALIEWGIRKRWPARALSPAKSPSGEPK